MPTKFKVNDIRRVPSGDPNRITQWDRVVMYETSPTDRSVVRIPEEEFTEERMIQAVKEDIAERAKWSGKEFEFE